MTDWKPIATFDQADNVVVDLWIEISPAPDNCMQGRGFRITDAYRSEGLWHYKLCDEGYHIAEYVTHWMPLPEAPKKGQ